MNNSKRIETKFAALKEKGRAGLVTFITAGDPDLETCKKILLALPNSGADLIELGMPFSDPMADGPAIQRANQRALDNGMTLQKTLDLVKEFRQQDSDTPIILMGYYNPIFHMGVQRFVEQASEVGVDGLIIVDLPVEEDEELCHPARAQGIDWIRLVTPTTHKERLTKVLNNSSGFLYYVSITGITGTASAKQSSVEQAIGDIRNQSSLPIAVGFGIKTAENVRETGKFADAVVVGSAIINQIKSASTDQLSSDKTANKTIEFVRSLASGLHD